MMSRYVRKSMRLNVLGMTFQLALWAATGALAQPPEPQLRFLEGHAGPVYAVGYSPDGRLLVSGGIDGTVRVWDRTTGQPVSTTSASDKAILTLAVAPQGLSYAVGGLDGAVRWFDLGRPYPLVEWGGVPGQATALAASADARFVLTGDSGGILRWWDSQTKAGVRDFAGTPAPVIAGGLVEPQGLVFAVGADGGVRGWKLADGQPIGAVLTPPAAGLVALPDGKQVIVAGQDGWLRQVRWPPVAPQPLGAHTDQATSITASPDGKWLASGGVDQQVIVYQTADGKPLRTLTEGPGRITSLTASGDGSSVIAAGELGAIKTWKVADGAVVGTLAGHAGAVTGLAGHPALPQFASAGVDGVARLWDLPQPRRLLAGHGQPVQRVALSADGKTVWSLAADRTLRSWQTADGKAVRTLEKLPPNGTTMTVSGDGRWVVLGDAAGDLTAWSAVDGAPQSAWGGHLGAVTALARDPQGAGWLSAGADGVVKLWEAPLPVAEAIAGLPAAATLLAISADGKTLVASQADGAVVVLDVAAKKIRYQWASPKKSPVTALSLSADGARIWAADQSGQVRGWKLADGTPLGWFAGGADAVTSVSTHPRDALIATTSADGEVRLWRRSESDKILRPGNVADKGAPSPAAPPLPVATSADGLAVAAASEKGAISWLTLADSKPVRDGIELGARPRMLAVRPDGGELAAGDVTGVLHVVSGGKGAPHGRVRAHEGEVTGVSYHPGGSQVASSGTDGMVRVWQLPLTPSLPIAKHVGASTALAASVDGGRVFSAGADKKLKGIEVATGNAIFQVDQAAAVTALAASADNLVVGAADTAGGVSLRGASDGVLAVRLHAHAGPARGLAFPPRPAPWVSVGDDGVLRVWDIPSPPRVLSGHMGAVESVVTGPNGQTIATTGADKTVRLWNLGDGAPGWTLAHDMPIRAMGWKADSQQLATADAAHRVRVWNLVDGQQLAVLEGHAAAISALAWAPDGSLLSASADGNVKVWSVAEKKESATLAAGAPLTGMAIVASSQALVTAHADGTLKTWQLADRKPIATIPVGAPVDALTISNDGKTALVACRDKSLRQFALAGGAAGPVVNNLPAAVRGIAWTADAQKFAAALDGGAIRVWAAAGELLEELDLGPGAPGGLAFTPDGKSVIVGSDDRQVRIARLLALKKITVGPQPLTAVAFSNDAATVAVAGRDKTVSLWNVASGAAVRSLAGCTDVVTAVAVSPDGSKVFATSLDKQLRVWNLADGQLIATLPQPATCSGVRVSRDGQRLAVTLVDGSVRVVDVATGRTLQVYAGAPVAAAKDAPPAADSVAAATFGADNNTIVMAGADGNVARHAIMTIAAYPAHAPGVAGMAWSPNGQHFVTAGADKQVKVHDLQGKVVATMAGGEFDVVSLALRRDGAQTVAITRDQQLVFWQTANGQQERKIPLPSPASSVAYTLDQTRVLVAGTGEYYVFVAASGRMIEAGPLSAAPVAVACAAPPATSPVTPFVSLDATGQLEWRSLRLERVLTGHVGAATSSAFTPDGLSLITGGVDKTVRQWTIANGTAARAFAGPTDGVTGVGVSGDGTRVAAIGADKTVRVWNYADGAAVAAVVIPAPLRQLATVAEARQFVAIGDDQVVRVFDFASGREAQHFPAGGAVTGVSFSTPGKAVWTGPEIGVRAQVAGVKTQWLADPTKVLVAAWMPDGKQIVTCGEDRVVKIWNRDGTPVKSLAGYPVPPTAIAVRPDGAVIAVAGQVGAPHANVFFWKVADGLPLPTLATPVGVAAMSWAPDGKLAVAGVDQHVRIYGQEPLLLLEDLTLSGNAADLVFSAEGKQLWAATADNQVQSLTPACRRALVGHQGALSGVAYSADGRLLLTASVDKSIRVWDGATGQWLATCVGSPAPLTALAVTRDGQRVAAFGSDNQIRVWSLAIVKDAAGAKDAPAKDAPATAAAPQEITLQGSWAAPAVVRTLSWNGDGARLVSGGDDLLVRLWDVARETPAMATDFARELQRWAGHTGPVTSVSCDQEGQRIVSASVDRTVVRWSTSSASGVKAHEGAVHELRLSGDGKSLFSTGADKLVRIWDAATLKPLRTLTGATSAVKLLATSGDGALAVAGDESVVRLWTTAEGKPLVEVKQPVAVTAVELSVDGRRVFVATADNAIRQYRLERKGDKTELLPIIELKGPASPATRLALAADQRTLYSTHADQGVRSWLVSSGAARFVGQEHARPVYAVAFSPDGTQLASGGADRTVRVWNLAEGSVAATGSGHVGAVHAVAFAPQGKELASAGAEGVVQFWDAELKPTEKITVGITGRLHTVAYSLDGKQVFTAGSARAWQTFQRTSLLRTRNVEGHNDTIYRLTLNPAGNRAATIDYAGHLAIWDVASGNLLFHQQMPLSPAFGLAYSPDGAELAVATRDARVVRATVPAGAR